MSALLPLLVEPQQLASALDEPQLLIVDLSNEANYAARHIPGAIHLPFSALMAGVPPAPGRLPSKERLETIFSALGLTPDTHVVVYDDEGGGWAGRLLWTLDVIGHPHYSYLNGGRHAWLASGEAVTSRNETIATSSYRIDSDIDTRFIAEIDDIVPSLEEDSVVIWDARSPEEYRGEKVFAQRGGHIPGAINIEWTELMDKDNHFRIRVDAKAFLASRGIDGSKPIITHCQSHHRSAFTYLVGKILGFNISGYHGSWSEWGNHPSTPIETGA